MRFFLLFFLGIFPVFIAAQFLSVDFKPSFKDNEIEVYMEGQLFTRLIYPNSLNKYILYPLYTASGIEVTGNSSTIDESTTHQIGSWFAFGEVNGMDFWSTTIDDSSDLLLGSIRITEPPVTDPVHASLTVQADWDDNNGNILLKEKTVFYFDGSSDTRTIRRNTRLTAYNKDLIFKKNVKGLAGLLVDSCFYYENGGILHNSEGDIGQNIPGNRSTWISLTGRKEQRDITITLFDVPGNHNYPAWPNVDKIGLFALNNLQGNDSDLADDEIALHLKKGESVSFMHILTLTESWLP